MEIMVEPGKRIFYGTLVKSARTSEAILDTGYLSICRHGHVRLKTGMCGKIETKQSSMRGNVCYKTAHELEISRVRTVPKDYVLFLGTVNMKFL